MASTSTRKTLSDEEVGSVDDIHHMLAVTAAGSTVTLTILRENSTRN